MFKKLFFTLFIVFEFLIGINSEIKACNNYPYESGLNISKNKNNLVIKSTSQVKVFINDADEINDSYLEAENIAITNIAKYVKTKVNLKQKKNQIQKSSKNNFMEEKEINSSTDIYNLESQLTLSGIKIINKCYKENDYVRVTVILDELKLNAIKNLKVILNHEN